MCTQSQPVESSPPLPPHVVSCLPGSARVGDPICLPSISYMAAAAPIAATVWTDSSGCCDCCATNVDTIDDQEHRCCSSVGASVVFVIVCRVYYSLRVSTLPTGLAYVAKPPYCTQPGPCQRQVPDSLIILSVTLPLQS